MATVISPRLEKFPRFGELDLGTKNRSYFCIGKLKGFVEIPKAKYYWVEASTKQFPERNGVAVRVKSSLRGGLDYFKKKEWFSLEDVLGKYLDKLGLEEDSGSKKIYFRLWYQE